MILRTALLLLLVASPNPAQAAGLRISEAFYDAVGSDNGLGFVELHGNSGASLDGYRIEGVNGSGGAVGPVLGLTGNVPSDGFFVVADDDGSGASSVANSDLLLNFDFQNGPDSIVLVAPDDSVVDALGYGIFGAGDVLAGEGNAAAAPPAGRSLARLFANIATDDNLADFVALDMPTPGSGPLALPEPGMAVLLTVSLLLISTRSLVR